MIVQNRGKQNFFIKNRGKNIVFKPNEVIDVEDELGNNLTSNYGQAIFEIVMPKITKEVNDTVDNEEKLKKESKAPTKTIKKVIKKK